MEISSFVFVCLLTITGATINQIGNNLKINELKLKCGGKENSQDELAEKCINGLEKKLERELSGESKQIQRIALIEESKEMAFQQDDSKVLKARTPPKDINRMDQVPNSSEEKPFQPTRPVEQPTTGIGKPTNNHPPVNPTGATRTTPSRGPKQTGDGDDNGDDGKKTSGAKKSPSSTQASDFPGKTSDPWGGEYMLPTQAYQPRWMRNDTNNVLPNILLIFSSIFALLFITI